MLRNEWEFVFAAAKLAEAASAKKSHHQDRLKWWEEQKAIVMHEVKDTGIEVSEPVAATYSNKMSGGFSPQVMVRADLQGKLSECHNKIIEHASKVREYDGWVTVLTANAEERLKLNADDFLYFFGSQS